MTPYQQAVEELKIKFKNIRNEYRSIGEYSPIEFVTGRVKKISSILEKANQNRVPIDQIADKMEDIAGIRIMCQFVTDIYRVVDLLKERNGKDLIIIEEKNYVQSKKNSGYRSYHVVIEYPVQTAWGEKRILAEIQIRTLAMNFWATIEHSLNYKYEHNLPINIQERLKKAAEAAFRLDEEMSEIHLEIQEAQRVFEAKSHVVSDILDNIQSLFMYGKVIEASIVQKKLHSLWEVGNIPELTKLLEETNEMIKNSKERL